MTGDQPLQQYTHGNHPVSPVGLVEPGSATKGEFAELLGNLIRHSIQCLMSLTVRLIEECLLSPLSPFKNAMQLNRKAEFRVWRRRNR